MIRGSRPRANAALIMPLSVTLLHSLQLNLNAGGQWTRSDRGGHLVAGAQLTAQLGPAIELMAEGFGLSGQKAGGQTGLRWTFDEGRADLDLLAGRYVDGTARSAVTICLTLRR